MFKYISATPELKIKHSKYCKSHKCPPTAPPPHPTPHPYAENKFYAKGCNNSPCNMGLCHKNWSIVLLKKATGQASISEKVWKLK